MTPALARVLAAYNAEMNARLFAAADALGEDARRAERGAFWGSIHGTLSHLLWADRIWLARFGMGGPPDAALRASAAWVVDWEDLRARRAAEDAAIAAWAAALTQEDLSGRMAWFSGALGREIERPAALLVMHVFNHQTHHRGQVHAMLTAAGARPGDTDLPFVLDDAAFG